MKLFLMHCDIPVEDERFCTAQGYHSGGTLIGLVGAVKGVAAAPVRGTVGVLESVSKSAHGVGLIFLGREAISGSVQRRIRAPGAFSHDDSFEVHELPLSLRRSAAELVKWSINGVLSCSLGMLRDPDSTIW